MTVAELIEVLSKMPQAAEVLAGEICHSGQLTSEFLVQLNEDGQVEIAT